MDKIKQNKNLLETKKVVLGRNSPVWFQLRKMFPYVEDFFVIDVWGVILSAFGEEVGYETPYGPDWYFVPPSEEHETLKTLLNLEPECSRIGWRSLTFLELHRA